VVPTVRFPSSHGLSSNSRVRMGDERQGLESSGNYDTIIFRRGHVVVDLYVSATAHNSRQAVDELAQVIDHRLGGATVRANSMRRHAPVRATSGFAVQAWVSPSSMPYDAYPTFYARTRRGAQCHADVVYSTGRSPVSFGGGTQTVGSSGVTGWSWHEETKGNGGTGFVTCQFGSQSKTVTTTFTVY